MPRYFGEGSRPYPSDANTYLVALCTGSFAAAAISTSRTISELIPAGIEAVLAAFRTGLCSLELRNDIERPSNRTPRSWSAVVSASEAQAAGLLQSFNSKNVRRDMVSQVRLTNRSRLYLEAPGSF